jgi:hypothetical protein
MQQAYVPSQQRPVIEKANSVHDDQDMMEFDHSQ